MAGDQDPGSKPPEGTPASKAGDAGGEKLIFGKYKTIEEAEKAHKEGETKYHEGQQKLSETEKLLEIEKQRTAIVEQKQEEIRQAKTQEEKKKLEQDLDQIGIEFRKEADKSPGSMIRGFHRIIDAYIATQGFVRKDDLKRRSAASQKQTDIYNRVRAAHKEDFDELAPKIIEIWKGLPPQTRMLPSEKLMETIYKAAKAENLPDEAKIREKIIADMRAGHGEGGGEKLTTEKKSESEKETDAIVAAHKGTKVNLTGD